MIALELRTDKIIIIFFSNNTGELCVIKKEISTNCIQKRERLMKAPPKHTAHT